MMNIFPSKPLSMLCSIFTSKILKFFPYAIPELLSILARSAIKFPLEHAKSGISIPRPIYDAMKKSFRDSFICVNGYERYLMSLIPLLAALMIHLGSTPMNHNPFNPTISRYKTIHSWTHQRKAIIYSICKELIRGETMSKFLAISINSIKQSVKFVMVIPFYCIYNV